jgi:hypothetical protein
MSLTMVRKPVRVTHFLESVMVWRKMKRGQSLFPVVIGVSLRMERLMGYELAQNHGLQVGVLPAQAWLLRCSG